VDGGEAHTVGVATWNIELGGVRAPKTAAKLNLLRALRRRGAEVIALQEVLMPVAGPASGLATLAELVADGTFAHVIVPAQPTKRTADRGCAILASARFKLASRPRRIHDTPSPERSCVVDLIDTIDDSRRMLTTASVHWVPGSDTTEKATGARWGPEPKRRNFRAVARWMAGQTERAIVGIDCNSPLVDHPDLAEVVYHTKRIGGLVFDQEEHLLHDPDPARYTVRAGYRHTLRDSYRTLMAMDQHVRRQALRTFRRTGRDEIGRGCLAVTHEKVWRGRPPWRRRFDFIFATPDITPLRVVHVPIAEAKAAGSSHAPVFAILTIT
jgi:endonuclease/exonuclease/phosphatase family metal-dependent hydrolase